MIKLALCGAHGTGKTTILKDITKLLPTIPILKGSIRAFWEESGVHDFEKLPPDVRSQFQKHQLLNQIKREDIEGQNGFLTDRSVADYWGYTIHSSDMREPDLSIYKELIKSRLTQYTHFIFVPVMFPAQNEHLRANIESRDTVSAIMFQLIQESLAPEKYLLIEDKDHHSRMRAIQNYLGI